MKKMKAGEIPASIMPAMQRWSYGRSTNPEIKALAVELFGKTDPHRGKVIADYQSGIAKLTGRAHAGKAVFEKAACITCHRKGEVGVEVGPSLADVKIKPMEALLTDIFDPNRAVEERWSAYQVETRSGQNFAGLIASETSAAIEIRLPGGHSETISRDQILKTTATGLSLMPVGLEGLISKQDLADLLAFLKE
jgi:putative heme-binding domain-containing protein